MERFSTLTLLQNRELSYNHFSASNICRSYGSPGYTWDFVKGIHRVPDTNLEHDGCVNSVRFTTDGTRLISGSDDKTVKLWTMYDFSYDLCATIKTNHTQNIFCADLCRHNENYVVTCAGDGTLRLNDLNDLFSVDEHGSTSNGHGFNYNSLSSAPDKLLLSKETTLLKNKGIMHMFHFDIDQPMVLYTASDSGKIHRVDLRIAQSINRDMFVDGTSNNNSNSSGGDVIFCNYMTSGKPNSASNLGSVKALTQSSSLGSSQLFVGGVGYAIGLLDMRMNIDASSHVQNMLLHGRISTCSKRKSKESLLTPTTTPFVAPSAVTVPVAPSARSTAANISSPDRVEHDQVSDSDRDDSDSDEVSDSTSVGTMMNTIDALVVRANQGDEGAQRQAIAICRRVGIDPGDMMQNRPLFEAMNSNPAAMLEQLYPGGVGLQGDLTNLARQIARTANGDDDEEDSDGDVAPANPVAVAVSGATLPSALASAFRSTKMLKKAKNQETETLDVMDEIRSVLFVKMYGPHFIEPVSGVSAAMDKSAIRSGAGRSARYGGSARLYPDDPLADSDTDCESDEDPEHIPGKGTTSDGNYAKKLLIKLSDKADAVSISGMQCSKNGQLLLASYQGDQIYTFNVNDVPVGDSHSHCKGREYTDIMCSENGVGNSNIREQGCSSNYHDPSDSLSYENWNSHTRRLLDYGLGKGVGARTVIGGHINYATFLKTVSFYGPRDEYIVSGSDSGCMWIWDANSGAVVGNNRRANKRGTSPGKDMWDGYSNPARVLNVLIADKSTCNGVVPHPYLPILASYGIDSDIKLWKYATPDSISISATASPAKVKADTLTTSTSKVAASVASTTTINSHGSTDSDNSNTSLTQSHISTSSCPSTSFSSLPPYWYSDPQSVLPELPYFLEITAFDICKGNANLYDDGYHTKALMSCTYTVASVKATSVASMRAMRQDPSEFYDNLLNGLSNNSGNVYSLNEISTDRLTQLLTDKGHTPTNDIRSKLRNAYVMSITSANDRVAETTDVFDVTNEVCEKDSGTSNDPASSTETKKPRYGIEQSHSVAILSHPNSTLGQRERRLRPLISSQFKYSSFVDQVFNKDRFALNVSQLRVANGTIPIGPMTQTYFCREAERPKQCLKLVSESEQSPCTYAQLECYTPDFPSDFHGKEYFYCSSLDRPETASLLPSNLSQVVSAHRKVAKSLKYRSLNALATIDVFMQEICNADSTSYCSTKCANIETAGEMFKGRLSTCATDGIIRKDIETALAKNDGDSDEHISFWMCNQVYESKPKNKAKASEPTVELKEERDSANSTSQLKPPSPPSSAASSAMHNKCAPALSDSLDTLITIAELIANLRFVALRAKEVGNIAYKRGDIEIALTRYEKSERYYRSIYKLCVEFLTIVGKNASYALKQMKVAVDEFASKAAVDDNDTETFAMSNGDEPISPTRSSENNHNGESGSKKPRLNPRDSVESDLGANVMERRGSPMNVDSSDHESENNQSIDNANVTGNANQGNDSNPVHDMNECSESLSGAKPDADLLFRKAEYTIDWFDAKMTSLLIGMSSNEVAKLCKNSKNPVEKNEDVNTGCNNGADPDADTCTIANVGSAVDALVFYNKLIVVVQVALVDSFSMRKIAYSNAAAMNLQLRRYEDAYLSCAGAMDIMKSSDTVLSNCHCNSSNSTYPSTATGTSSTPSPFIFPSDYAVPDAKIHFRLGCACIGLKEYAQAVKALQIAISLSPGGQDVAINKKLQEAMRMKDYEKKKEEKKYSQMFSR